MAVNENENIIYNLAMKFDNREDMFTLTKRSFDIKSRAEIFLNIWNGPTQSTGKFSLKLMNSAVNTVHMKTL